jgi:phage-related protein (TIGR01555 family)
MSGRIVNVRPKPGFLMDGAGDIIATRQNVVQFQRDRLTNIMSGMGTTADKRAGMFYSFVPMTGEQAEAGYRSSWLVRKIVDVPPFDMTREWRDWQADGAAIEKLEGEEKRLKLRAKVQRALVLARLFGGAGLVLGTGDADTTQPLNPRTVKAQGLRYARVLSRWQLSEGQQRLDPDDPWVDQPDFYTLSVANGQQIKLHPSRVVPFIGQKTPEGGFYSSTSWFWGDPIMQSIGEAVKNADLAQSGFASLIDRAAVDVFRFKDLMSTVGTQEGEDRITRRVAWTSQAKSTHRAMLLDKEDEWDQVQITWASMTDVMMAFLNVVAGAADIPVTRLLGQSPKGLQSNGDGEERDYNKMIKAQQTEVVRPALDQIDELLIPSALGSAQSDVYYEFAPLDQLDEKDAATVEKQAADTIKVYADTGIIPDVALSAMAKNRIVESGRWPGSEKAFEEAEAAIADDPRLDPLNPDNQEPDATIEQRVAAMEKKGTVTPQDAIRLIRDASPRSLYVSRKLLNGAEFIKWAKGQGFETTVPADELHVTVLFSRTPVDWMAMGSTWSEDDKGQLKVPPGGARLVEPLGDKGAVVLLFNSSALSWRHEEMVRNGASHDFDSYQPHVTISYAGSDLDLSKVEPFRGELVFGPEIFTEVVEDWEQSLTES